ncbi:SDR family NAD(P)-dependent oxidoreductase [Nocardiopsis sp. RSe5-2]|uniref:SDR family NAD(P)-dependent oxidoreductase n=1 Tax=Nocardiopsis endophytica TaxID=3018445 RepID=A0ABT4TYS2_9ACTN|nr:SDR family NAD(P)-dependent oxidoreductase [Nocardiopsis endophytica]MDA2809861.1 SDR family NAD(P)-dependent oxidoreductase [Nocardiopsis endophytica]
MGAFNGKTVLVTGGASGIGAATVRRAAADGGRVLIADVAEEAGSALAAETGARFVRTDVTRFADMEAAVAAAVETGGLDVLHLNAGVTGPSEGLADQGVPFSLEAYRTAVAVNLDGVVHGVHAALPHMRRREGASVVVTSSLAGLTGTPYGEVYAATKHAVVGLVRSLAGTFPDDPVTFNAVCPGFVDTPMTAGIQDFIERIGKADTVIPPEAVADLVERIVAERGDGEAWIPYKGGAARYGFADPLSLMGERPPGVEGR